MVTRPPAVIVLIYQSYRDPLFQNLMLEYLRTIVKSQGVQFHLITFEQSHYALTNHEIRREKALLKKEGIIWFPQSYRGGKFILIKKVIEITNVVMLVGRLKYQYGVQLIFSFANIAASMGIFCSRLFSIPMLVYCYEPHSDYLVELGIWKKSSLKYRISKFIEMYAGKNADYVLASTKYVIDLLYSIEAKGKVIRAPVSVNENSFVFKPEGREQIRSKYNVRDRRVLLYLGKFGYLYYNEEISQLCRTLFEHIKSMFFLIVTSNDKSRIQKMFRDVGLPIDSYAITGNLSYDEVKDYISAADIGLSGVPPTPAQKYRSPTKVAEYLLCGLPYITCKGVSEDDVYAMENNVGVVLKSFNKEDVMENIVNINILLSEEKESLRNRCRKVGIEYRGMTNVDKLLEKVFNEVIHSSKVS